MIRSWLRPKDPAAVAATKNRVLQHGTETMFNPSTCHKVTILLLFSAPIATCAIYEQEPRSDVIGVPSRLSGAPPHLLQAEDAKWPARGSKAGLASADSSHLRANEGARSNDSPKRLLDFLHDDGSLP